MKVLREVAREYGYKTRSNVPYKAVNGFFRCVLVGYLDSKTDTYKKGDGRLAVQLDIKPSEVDSLFWKICDMEDEADHPSPDPIFGLDVVFSVCIAEQDFPLGAIEEINTVCRQVLEFAESGYAQFAEQIGNSVNGFYEYVLSLPYERTWGAELLFPIAYIQLGRIQEALDFLNNDSVYFRMQSHHCKGRSSGDYFRDYCATLLNKAESTVK
jgi:hypothetical protein